MSLSFMAKGLLFHAFVCAYATPDGGPRQSGDSIGDGCGEAKGGRHILGYIFT
jgi:hypothetical protein